MTNKRAYGDAMIAACVRDLQNAGVHISETKSSGSVAGDCDAKMQRGGLMLEGKASYTEENITANYHDMQKAIKQAKEHGQIAILVTENKYGDRWAWMTPENYSRAGLSTYISVDHKWIINSYPGLHWTVQRRNDTSSLKIVNGAKETVMGLKWDLFVELISEVWADDSEDTGETSGQEKKSFGNKRSFQSKGRKFRSKRFR